MGTAGVIIDESGLQQAASGSQQHQAEAAPLPHY